MALAGESSSRSIRVTSASRRVLALSTALANASRTTLTGSMRPAKSRSVDSDQSPSSSPDGPEWPGFRQRRERVRSTADAPLAGRNWPCSYDEGMNVATTQVEVGIRELKNGLSRYIDRARAGEEVIVTDRGRPVARLSSIDQPTDRLAALVASGAVRPPTQSARLRPRRRIQPKGSVTELLAEQRR